MNLTRGRKEPCKNSPGGIKELYLMTYVDYDNRSIVGYRNLLITSFPESQIYKYKGQDKSFTESYNQDGFYTQQITISLTKQDLDSAILVSILSKVKVRAIVMDYNGNYRMAGVINGLDVEVNAASGSIKSDFNGYSISLSGIEEFSAPFISSLLDSGLTDKDIELGCILASSDRAASMSDLVSSCESVTSSQIVYDCLLSSSNREASMSQLVSSCNIAV